jgi:hypothetical protein
VPNDTFLGYTENTVIDRVYNIVMDGSMAVRVVDAPYATRAVRGIIYSIADRTISIRDATYLNPDTGVWMPVSNTNATLVITVPQNSIIVKNNRVAEVSGLVAGDQIKVMTDTLPERPAAGSGVTGYILHVEN